VANNVLRNFKGHSLKAGISGDEKITLQCLRKSYAQTLADGGTAISMAKNVEKGATGSAEMGATQATNNSVLRDAVKAFSATGRTGTHEKLLIHH
jgi:hypothetical protein